MEDSDLTEACHAIGQRQRMRIIRLLFQGPRESMPAGEIGERLGIRQNTLSSHLGILRRAGLVSNERVGRLILYRAERSRLKNLSIVISGLALTPPQSRPATSLR